MTSKELISQSVDARGYRFDIKLNLGVFLALILFVSLVWSILFWDNPKVLVKALIGYNTVVIICYTPGIWFPIAQLTKMLKKSDTYIFSEAVLSEFHPGRRRFYFRITITTEEGQQITGNTDSFYKPGASIIDFEEWYNKSVLVAYDPETEKMIVVGHSQSFRKPDN